MSTLETILSRAMNDPAFAEALISQPAEALAEYDLSAEELEIFKGLPHVDFENFAAVSPEERKSLVSAGVGRLISTDGGKTW